MKEGQHMDGYQVTHSIYSEPDQFGHRTVIARPGHVISWEQARALGLVGRPAAEETKP
jgi:hypothetical protein